jgi:hypothetical protein
VVAGTSRASKEARMTRLLERAAVMSQYAAARAVYEQHAHEQQERERDLDSKWRAVRVVLSDLNMLGLMAVVLSRSAMIEASSGSAELREQLTHVSREFYDNSEAVVGVIKALTKSVNGT